MKKTTNIICFERFLQNKLVFVVNTLPIKKKQMTKAKFLELLFVLQRNLNQRIRETWKKMGHPSFYSY